MNVGYARVFTSSQNLDNQINQLKDAGCVKIFSEKKSGKNKADRQQFNVMMDFVREGDILFITKLDRLARSVIDLQNIVLKFAFWRYIQFFHVTKHIVLIHINGNATYHRRIVRAVLKFTQE